MDPFDETAALPPVPGDDAQYQRRQLRDRPLHLFAAVTGFAVVVLAIALALVAARDDDDQQAVAATADSTATARTQSPASVTVTAPPDAATATGAVASAFVTPTAGQPTEAAAVMTPVADRPPANASQSPQTPASDAPSLLERLPGLEQLPAGFVIAAEGLMTAEELAALHPEPEAESARLLEWGFQEAARREFELPDAPEDAQLTGFVAGVARFGSAEQARAALDFHHEEAKAADGAQLHDSWVTPLGDAAIAATGTVTYEGQTLHLAYVSVQVGNLAYTFVGTSPAADPLPRVAEIARATVR